jgi:translation initiation factor 5A
MSDNEFEVGDSGAANITLVEAGRRKAGSLLMMKEEFPCKVTNLSTAKPGKHGSAKAMIVAKDIFTDKQYEETFGTGDMIPAPVVKKTEYVCIDMDADLVLNLMTSEGELKEDLSLPSESHLSHLEKEVRALLEKGTKECLVVVQVWGDRQQAIAVREGQDQ